ncbi:CoA-binding protein [Botrimarina sp.]|uniref:CoA-binding protein n=1 Tax=Botrimarina sp. TaxID=2795802 RepID=UPI0032EC6824
MAKPTVAVIGASSNPAKFSAQSVRAHAECGYEVFPVNPRGGEAEGRRVYRAIGEVPAGPLDRVTMYVPPEVGLTLIDAIAEKGCRELWLNPGAESDELVELARQRGLNPIVACSLVDCRSRGAHD